MIKLKKLISLMLVTTMIAGTTLTTNFIADETDKKNNATDYIVVTKNEKALEEANEISNDCEELMKISNKDTISKMAIDTSELSQLNSIDGVVSVEKDIVLSGSTNDDTNSDEVDVLDCLFKEVNTNELNQWNLQSLGVDDEKSVSPSEKVKVELLDSGVSWSDDINVKYRENLIEDDIGINPLYEDYSQHGTGMAGVICAKDNGKGIIGVNPNVDLYSVRALDDNIQAPLSRIIQGIYWGIDNDMDIINMSFGTNTNSSVLRTAIKAAHDKGIVLVAASGNDKEKGVQYPAAYPEVISVGSQSASGEISEFTSIDENLDVIAPGENIESTGIFGTINGSDGTSIATAQVTGIASLILEKDKSKSPDFVKDLILKSSKKISDNGIVTGAVDGKYALSIYDDFAKNYSENKNTPEYTNPNDIEEYNTDGYVKGLWFQKDHANMSKEGANFLDISNDNYVELIASGAKAPDKTQLYKFNSNSSYVSFKKISAFHGGGNYVANFKCAWRFVCLLKKYGNSKTLKAIGAETKEYASKLSCYSSKTTKNTIDELIDSLAIIDTLDFKTNLRNGKENSSKTHSLYKAIGMCFHMIGDTYAHRTQVPVSYYKDKFEFDFQKKYGLNKDLFINAKSFNVSNQLKQNIIDACQTNTVDKKYRFRQHLKTAVSYGVVEFRDIKKFSDGYYSGTRINDICSVYEDNSNFYNRRFEEAYLACDQVGIEGYKTPDIYVFKPSVNDAGTSVKLWDFKNYAIKANYSSDILEENEWKICTSFPKKVDSNGKVVNK